MLLGSITRIVYLFIIVLLTIAAGVVDANEVSIPDHTRQRKLVSIETADANDPTKLAALGDTNGFLTVEFVEPEEGFIFVLGTEKDMNDNVLMAADTTITIAPPALDDPSLIFSTLLGGDNQAIDEIDPVALYQELSGLPAPARLLEANERRKTFVFVEPLERPPLLLDGEDEPVDEKQNDWNTSENNNNNNLRRGLQSSTNNGVCRAKVWEEEQCGYQAHTVNFCYCYSCRTGNGAVGGEAVNMFIRGQAYRGAVTQRVKFWRCDPDSGRDCRYKMLTAQTVSQGTIVTARGIGNGQVLTWRAQMDHADTQGWNW
jgi:hypothetical protein